MPHNRLAALLPLLVCALLASRCATPKPLGGGPVDAEPPRVIETIPAPGSTHFAGESISFTFDEYVDRQSFEQSFHLSPVAETPPAFSWSGRRVVVTLGRPLRDSTTYVATVGSTVRDVRAGNQLGQTVTLAFSTGDRIDAGTLAGSVVDDKPSGVSVFAYRLDTRSGDTLSPARTRPDYAVQSGTDGSFRFTNIAGGLYRVLAVRDKQNNYLYDAETDAYGVALHDVRVVEGDSTQPAVTLRLATEDTTRPSLQSVKSLHAQAVLLRLNEDPDTLITAQIAVQDSSTARSFPAMAVERARDARYAFVIWFGSVLPQGPLFLRIDSLRDRAGNIAPPEAVSLRFETVTDSDTARLRLTSITPARGQKDVDPAAPFEFTFSHPMSRALPLVLRDSTGAVLPTLPVVWTTPLHAQVAHAPLQGAHTYTLCLDGTALRDSIRGMSLADSALCHSFTTAKDAAAGSITGAVRGADSLAAPRVLVRARGTEKRLPGKATRAAADGRYSLPEMPAGSYLLEAFVDDDGNGTWSPGRPSPFTPSERFGLATDTVRVRARWETRDVTIRLR